MSPHEELAADLRRIGFPISQELTLRRGVQAAMPPASAAEIAKMARSACVEGERLVNGGEGCDPDPIGAMKQMIVVDELLIAAEVARLGIGRG